MSLSVTVKLDRILIVGSVRLKLKSNRGNKTVWEVENPEGVEVKCGEKVEEEKQVEEIKQ